jgi:predicted nucleic acid-binding protein
MTRAYLDSSALVKRIFDEPESTALRAALDQAHDDGVHLVSSALARVEVGRVARTRLDFDVARVVAMASIEAMDGISTAHLTKAVLDSARIIGPPVLRTLDAIHLATAVALSADEVWTYDDRMAQVAEELGIPSRMPGRDAV